MRIHHLVVCETCFQNLGRNRVSLEFLNCDTLLKSALCYYINDLIPEEIEITLSRQWTKDRALRVRVLQNNTGSQYSFVINCTAFNAGEDTLELPERWWLRAGATNIVGGTATADRVNRLHRKWDVKGLASNVPSHSCWHLCRRQLSRWQLGRTTSLSI